MSEKDKDISKSISTALAEYEQTKTVNEYFKKKLGTERVGSKIAADAVFDNIVNKALNEKRPEWTPLLMNIVGADQKSNASQTNVQINIGEFLNNLKE